MCLVFSIHIVQYTVFIVQGSAFSVQYSVFYCSVFSIYHSVLSVQYSGFCIMYSVCSTQFSVFRVFRILYSVFIRESGGGLGHLSRVKSSCFGFVSHPQSRKPRLPLLWLVTASTFRRSDWLRVQAECGATFNPQCFHFQIQFEQISIK